MFSMPPKCQLSPASVAKIIEPFPQYGITKHRDESFCVPCYHSFTATTAQNVTDHLTSDVHDDRLANSVHAKTFHLAPGYSELQKEHDQIWFYPGGSWFGSGVWWCVLVQAWWLLVLSWWVLVGPSWSWFGPGVS